METILIAEGNEVFRREVAGLLAKRGTVLTAADGEQAFELLARAKPDLLILDLHLTGVDGITLLRRCKEQGLLPPVLVTARMFSGYVTDALADLEVGYLMLLPCKAGALAERAEEMLDYSSGAKRSRENIRRLLEQFGLTLRMGGTKYLLSAVGRMEAKPALYLTKELYPALAKEFGVSDMAVEKAMRDAIRKGWLTGDPALWRKHFPHGKPDNGAFMARLAELDRQLRRGGCWETLVFPYDTREKWTLSG